MVLGISPLGQDGTTEDEEVTSLDAEAHLRLYQDVLHFYGFDFD